MASKMVDVGTENSEVMTTALLLAVQMWVREEFEDIPKPSTSELDSCVTYLMDLPHVDLEDSNAKTALSMLILNNIGTHFHIVASHRRWIDLVYELCKIAKVPNLPELEERIAQHDLSKYGPQEALGYSIMFGWNGKYRQLKGEDKEIWGKALSSHYRDNPHHPQYHNHSSMHSGDLEESLLDVLACRLERDFRYYSTIDADMIMDIPLSYLKRYKMGDRLVIEGLIQSWHSSLQLLAAHPTDEQQRLLDGWGEDSELKLMVKADSKEFYIEQSSKTMKGNSSTYC